MAKEQELDIAIMGRLDPSVMATVNAVKAALKNMGADARTSSEVMKRTYAQMFDGLGDNAEKEFKKAKEQADSFNAFMGRVKETFTGVFAADIAVKFFDTAVAGAQRLVDTLKEAGIQAASMEQIKMELGIEMGTGGVPASKEVVNQWIDKLQYFSDTTTIQMRDAADAFRGALATGYTPNAAFDIIKRVTDVAAATVPMGMSPSEHFKQIQETYLNAIKGGNLMEKTIRPLEREGIQIRPYLERRLGLPSGGLGRMGEDMTPEQTQTMEDSLHALYKTIKKGEVPAHFLEDFFKEITGPGGKYAGGAEAMGKTAIGGWSTLLDKFQTIMRGIGSTELGPFEAIVDKINASFTPEAYANVQKFFDGMASKINTIFSPLLIKTLDDLIANLSKGDWSKVQESGGKAMEGLAKVIQKAGPILDWLAQDLPDEINSILRLTAGIENFFATLEKAVDFLLGMGPKIAAASSVTPSDAVGNAQDKLNALVSAGASDAQISAAKAELAAAQRALPHQAAGGIVTRATALVAGESGPEAILPLSALADSPLMRDSIKVQSDTLEELGKLNEALIKLTDNMAASPFGLGSGYGGGGGPAGGGPNVTEYGPGVAGDQPGGPTYDWNSYHRVGAWPGITGPLRPGDVALGYGAQAHYHVSPGQTFVDDQGRTVRFADRSGSKNTMNEDIFRLAAGGIVKRATRAIIGESGPEAVVPLSGGGGFINLHYAPVIHGFGDIRGLLRQHADELLVQLESALSSRFASMASV